MLKVIVGLGTCGVSSGAKRVQEKLEQLLSNNPAGKKVELSITGCMGLCYREPLLEIREDKKRTIYGDVTEDVCERIFDSHICQGIPVEENIVLKFGEAGAISGIESGYFENQKRIVLRNCGYLNPEIIEEYESVGGYIALKKAVGMQPAQIISSIKESGLRGRGGGGFPTGLKWEFAAKQNSAEKYVICNADEGDPGAFMDRSVLEGDPHSVLEGMTICARAIGANIGYIYCRAEYPLAIKRLKIAIKQAEEHGYLGTSIFKSGFSFRIQVKEGAGAFVCGEETALMQSIEGNRGMPRVRPPFPAENGLWQKPTNINNVETFANVPWIIANGAASFSSIGAEKSKGTKVFALTGKVVHGGLVEVPMGITVNEIVTGVGGGIKDGRKFKAVQIGGPSGGCIPAGIGDTKIDYENVVKTGAIMGSGGLVVMDDTTCMVEIARFFLEFTRKESCGKCTFCRIGTVRMLEILERITRGEGVEEDIAKLKKLALHIKEASLCGLGQTAPNPVLTTLKYFLDEYEAHIIHKKCPAKYCSALVAFIIDAGKCTGCGICRKDCPVQAISGEKKQVHRIDQAKCVKCGRCITSCNFNAVCKDVL